MPVRERHEPRRQERVNDGAEKKRRRQRIERLVAHPPAQFRADAQFSIAVAIQGSRVGLARRDSHRRPRATRPAQQQHGHGRGEPGISKGSEKGEAPGDHRKSKPM
jgi:hypothetical protein